jgi:cation diffusion facilitator family transporter
MTHVGPATTTTSTSDKVRAAYREGARATLTALVMSIVLASVKIAAGILGSSYALVADGIESVLDVFSSVLVWSGLRMSASPPTPLYPYGRGKAEPLAVLAIAMILLIAAAGIVAGAIAGIVGPPTVPARFTLVVLVVVVLAKELTYRALLAKSRRVGSRAMVADAWHQRSDALTSLAAFVGIAVALVGGEAWASADDWAALAACAIIGWNGVRLAREGVGEVLDVSAPGEVHDRIRALARNTPGVEGIDLLRVRRSGLVYLVDIHVEVDGELSVTRGHELGHDVKTRLLESEVPILDALVHVEPIRRVARPAR